MATKRRRAGRAFETHTGRVRIQQREKEVIATRDAALLHAFDIIVASSSLSRKDVVAYFKDVHNGRPPKLAQR